MKSYLSAQNSSALLMSAIVHGVLLGALGLYRYTTSEQTTTVALETVIEDEREQQEFEQDVALDTTVSQSLSVSAGGMVSTAIGSGAAQAVGQIKIGSSEAMHDPDIRVVSIGDITIPGVATVGIDLGEGEVSGEVGARVEGYGAAMHRLTQEVVRMMRKQPVLAVWLFDASNSLKDDRKEIRENFNKIYEELNIAVKESDERGLKISPLQTMIVSFGERVNPLLPKPTDDLAEIRKAIDAVKEDESGAENTFGAINKAIDEYAIQASRNDRKLVIIVVSDETGDDAGTLEEVISKTERFKTPVYFLGREAVFGYPYAQVRWIDPEPPNLHHWIRVSRGPETAYPECLQYDGFHERWDSASAGFGPYPQVRLAKESGGIFFLLSTLEENLSGNASKLERKFDDLAMKQYEPILLSARDYVDSRNRSEFRKTIFDVIQALDPDRDELLKLRRWHYSMDPVEFDQEGKVNFERCVRSLQRMNEGIKRMELIQSMRAEESEPRWRAAFDLVYAQLLAYRVRQFQYLLALDKHSKDRPKPKDLKSNRWDIHNTPEMLTPDAQQVAATKVDMEELEAQRQKALDMYALVIKEHPGTPWAQRAEQEKSWGFGIAFHDIFWHPMYSDPKYIARVPKF